jgi:hypothetical protein
LCALVELIKNLRSSVLGTVMKIVGNAPCVKEKLLSVVLFLCKFLIQFILVKFNENQFDCSGILTWHSEDAYIWNFFCMHHPLLKSVSGCSWWVAEEGI